MKECKVKDIQKYFQVIHLTLKQNKAIKKLAELETMWKKDANQFQLMTSVVGAASS